MDPARLNMRRQERASHNSSTSNRNSSIARSDRGMAFTSQARAHELRTFRSDRNRIQVLQDELSTRASTQSTKDADEETLDNMGRRHRWVPLDLNAVEESPVLSPSQPALLAELEATSEPVPASAQPDTGRLRSNSHLVVRRRRSQSKIALLVNATEKRQARSGEDESLTDEPSDSDISRVPSPFASDQSHISAQSQQAELHWKPLQRCSSANLPGPSMIKPPRSYPAVKGTSTDYMNRATSLHAGPDMGSHRVEIPSLTLTQAHSDDALDGNADGTPVDFTLVEHSLTGSSVYFDGDGSASYGPIGSNYPSDNVKGKAKVSRIFPNHREAPVHFQDPDFYDKRPAMQSLHPSRNMSPPRHLTWNAIGMPPAPSFMSDRYDSQSNTSDGWQSPFLPTPENPNLLPCFCPPVRACQSSAPRNDDFLAKDSRFSPAVHDAVSRAMGHGVMSISTARPAPPGAPGQRRPPFHGVIFSESADDSFVKQEQDASDDVLHHILLPVMANMKSYSLGEGGYFNPFKPAPDWTIDHSPAGQQSYFGEDWGAPPLRVGRDPRYRAFQPEVRGRDDHGGLPDGFQHLHTPGRQTRGLSNFRAFPDHSASSGSSQYGSQHSGFRGDPGAPGSYFGDFGRRPRR